jgi:hypothetical protein
MTARCVPNSLLRPTTTRCILRLPVASHDCLLHHTTACCILQLPVASYTACCILQLPAATHDCLLHPTTSCCNTRLRVATHDCPLPGRAQPIAASAHNRPLQAELQRYAPHCDVAQVGARGRMLHDFCVRVAAPALSALAPAHCPFRAQPLEPGRHVRTGVLTGVRTGVLDAINAHGVPTGVLTYIHLSYVAGAQGPPKAHARGHSEALTLQARWAGRWPSPARARSKLQGRTPRHCAVRCMRVMTKRTVVTTAIRVVGIPLIHA